MNRGGSGTNGHGIGRAVRFSGSAMHVYGGDGKNHDERQRRVARKH